MLLFDAIDRVLVHGRKRHERATTGNFFVSLAVERSRVLSVGLVDELNSPEKPTTS